MAIHTIHDVSSRPEASFWQFAAIGQAISLTICVGLAVRIGLHVSGTEPGPIETLQIYVLSAAAVLVMASVFIYSWTGGGFLTLISLFLGLVALREFEAATPDAFLLYLASHDARYHLAMLCAPFLILAVWRGRKQRFRRHFSAVTPLIAPLLIGFVVTVAGSLVEELIRIPGLHHDHPDLMMWAEETLELAGYVVALSGALWFAWREYARRTRT